MTLKEKQIFLLLASAKWNAPNTEGQIDDRRGQADTAYTFYGVF